MKIVVTIVGKDRVGIIAMVSNILADNKVNILNINQNILEGFFNMIMIADMKDSKMSIKDLQQILKEKGEEIAKELENFDELDPKKMNYEDFTFQELRDIAKEHNLRGYGKFTKGELFEFIRTYVKVSKKK